MEDHYREEEVVQGTSTGRAAPPIPATQDFPKLSTAKAIRFRLRACRLENRQFSRFRFLESDLENEIDKNIDSSLLAQLRAIQSKMTFNEPLLEEEYHTWNEHKGVFYSDLLTKVRRQDNAYRTMMDREPEEICRDKGYDHDRLEVEFDGPRVFSDLQRTAGWNVNLAGIMIGVSVLLNFPRLVGMEGMLNLGILSPPHLFDLSYPRYEEGEVHDQVPRHKNFFLKVFERLQLVGQKRIPVYLEFFLPIGVGEHKLLNYVLGYLLKVAEIQGNCMGTLVVIIPPFIPRRPGVIRIPQLYKEGKRKHDFMVRMVRLVSWTMGIPVVYLEIQTNQLEGGPLYVSKWGGSQSHYLFNHEGEKTKLFYLRFANLFIRYHKIIQAWTRTG